MKHLALVFLVLLLVPVVEAQVGRVATDYIRISTQPSFQYRSDQDVVIPLQARVVKGGVPQPDVVHVEVRTTQGLPFPLPSGAASALRDGIQPYPRITSLDLGRLETGLYRVVLHVWGGGLERDWPVEFDVVYPPRPYSAALLDAGGNEARFVFEAHNAADNFTVSLYRDGPEGPVVLTRLTTSNVTLRVPYVPGESVKVSVADVHGWLNAENAVWDWQTGLTTYPPYTWNPDYQQIANYQRHSWLEALASGLMILLALGAFFLLRRRHA